MNWLAGFFRPLTAAQVLEQQLADAERLYVEHQAAAEMHAALSAVYRMRMERIRKHQPVEMRAVK